MDILTSNQLSDLVQRPDVIGGGRKWFITPAPDGIQGVSKTLEKDALKAIKTKSTP